MTRVRLPSSAQTPPHFYLSQTSSRAWEALQTRDEGKVAQATLPQARDWRTKYARVQGCTRRAEGGLQARSRMRRAGRRLPSSAQTPPHFYLSQTSSRAWEALQTRDEGKVAQATLPQARERRTKYARVRSTGRRLCYLRITQVAPLPPLFASAFPDSPAHGHDSRKLRTSRLSFASPSL